MGKGVNRFTDPASGRPVIEVTKEQLGAYLGKSSSRTATRAVSRWNQGAMNAGKGDMQRPQNKERADEGWLRTFCTWYTEADTGCECIECRKGRFHVPAA